MGTHGSGEKGLRGLERAARSSVDQGRFGRLFRSLPGTGHTEEALHELAMSMIDPDTSDQPITAPEPDDENPTVPAGYTYLGQFIDHDVTFDPVSTLQARNDPDALADFRTPRLDLDSLYGRGKADQPYLFERHDPIDRPAGNGSKFLLGDERRPASVERARPDLPRNGEGLALIGDPRNDENTIVSQLQSLFLRFHNRMLSLVPDTLGATAQFLETQRRVRWHYQWIVLHDFLPRIVGEAMADEVRPPGGAPPNLRVYTPKKDAFMPVEFSVAAYRYGHSMIRPSYSLSSDVLSGSDSTKNRVPIFSAETDAQANLRGFRPLPAGWGIDWAFFYPDLPQPPPQSPAGTPYAPEPDKPLLLPQPSYRIDTVLVDPLAHLPGEPVPMGPSGVLTTSLAERNLQRGRALSLPSGQAVARRLGEVPLTDADVWSNADDQGLDAKRKEILAAFPQFEGNAPLWFYILREAERTRREGFQDPNPHGGHHLGPVGGRIVAEVLVGLAFHDHHSYLYQDPLWRPQPPAARADGAFAMSDLIRFSDGDA
jgi:Animal haem peroxidase